MRNISENGKRKPIASHTPWIGNVTDGARDVVSIRTRTGELRYVTIEEILERCWLHESVDEANEERRGRARAQAQEVRT